MPDSAADRLTSAFDRHDAFALVAGLSLGSVFELPSRHNRRSARLPSFVVEYSHGFALQRDSRAPATPAPAEQPLGDLAEDAEMACAEQLRPASLLGADAGNLTATEKEAQGALRAWQIYGHDPGRPDAERKRLRAALDSFSEELRATVGFDVEQADLIIAVVDALTTMGVAQAFGYGPSDGETLKAKLAEDVHAGRALAQIPADLGERMSVTPDAIGELTAALGEEIPPDAVMAFLDRFSMPFGAVEKGGDPVSLLWEVRERPLLRDGDGNYLWTVPYNLAFAVRPVCERAIRELAGKTRIRYDKAKAGTLEIETLEELHNGLMADGTWRTLSYPSAADSRQAVEGDGLVLLDSVALAVECKAVELSPSARQGSAKALASKLEDAIVKGAVQAQRTRDALLGGEEVSGVVLWDDVRETVETDRLSRIVPLLVVLEPLGAVTSALWRLIDLSEPDTPWPWVVNIDDLAWFDRALAMPARLLHYAVVRQRIAAAGKFGAMDEADWFWMYFSQGAAAIYEKLAFLTQFQAKRTQFVGPDIRRGGVLPTDLATSPFEDLLIELHEARLPGWVEIALALLDLPPEAGERLARKIGDGRGATANGVSWFTEAPAIENGSLLLVGVGAPDRLRAELPVQLEGGQAQTAPGAAALICAIGIDVKTGKPVLCDWQPVAADSSQAGPTARRD